MLLYTWLRYLVSKNARGRAAKFQLGQRGALLAEIVIVMAVFTLIGTAMMSAVQTSLRTKNSFDGSAAAENLLRNQIAHVWEQDYKVPGEDYDTVDIASLGFDPAEWSVTAEVGYLDLGAYEPGCDEPDGDPDLSKICIVVTHNTKGDMKSMEAVRIAD